MGNRVVEFDTVGVHSWKVPGGVTSIEISMWGAGYPYGPVGITDPAFDVTPGQVLVFYVGGSRGFNGGHPGVIYTSAINPDIKYSTGGSGATDMRIGGARVMVAGGAGGYGLVYAENDGPGYFFFQGPTPPWAVASMPGADQRPRYPARPTGFPVPKFVGNSGGTFDGAPPPGEVFFSPDHIGPSGGHHWIVGGGGGGYGGGGTGTLYGTDDDPPEYALGGAHGGGSWSSQMIPAGGLGVYDEPRPDGTWTGPNVNGFVHIEYTAGKGGWHLGHIGWGRNQGW